MDAPTKATLTLLVYLRVKTLSTIVKVGQNFYKSRIRSNYNAGFWCARRRFEPLDVEFGEHRGMLDLVCHFCLELPRVLGSISNSFRTKPVTRLFWLKQRSKKIYHSSLESIHLPLAVKNYKIVAKVLYPK